MFAFDCQWLNRLHVGLLGLSLTKNNSCSSSRGWGRNRCSSRGWGHCSSRTTIRKQGLPEKLEGWRSLGKWKPAIAKEITYLSCYYDTYLYQRNFGKGSQKWIFDPTWNFIFKNIFKLIFDTKWISVQKLGSVLTWIHLVMQKSVRKIRNVI